MIDPDIRRLLDTLFNVPAPPGPPDVAQLRAAAEAAPKLLGGAPEALEGVDDAFARGPTGAVPVRIYRPVATAPRPLTLFAHGGGWVTGSLDSHDRLCRILANALSSVVVAVDYALAPDLPPAVIAVAAADVLRDDALDYARLLEAAGVPVRIVECRGMIHGFLRWTGQVAAARHWIDAIAATAREMMSGSRAVTP